MDACLCGNYCTRCTERTLGSLTGGVKWFQFQATEPVCLHSLEFNEHKIKIEQVKRMLWHTHSLTHCGTIQLRLTCAIHFHLARVVFLATTGANYRSNYTAAVQNKTCFYLTRQVVRVEKLNIAWLNADSSEIVVCKFATILLAKDEHSINIDSALATELVPDWTWIWLQERESETSWLHDSLVYSTINRQAISIHPSNST